MNNIPDGYKQTDVGVIPEGWVVSQLGDCGEVVMGQSPPGLSYNRIGIGSPLINGPTEFTNKYPQKIQWTSKPTKFCKPGDLLICVRGSSTGRTNYADATYCIGRGVGAIRALSDNVTDFLSFQIISAIGKILTATTGSTFPNIDGKSLRNIKIPLPPTKAEQEAIAQALSDADALIESLEKLIAKKRRIKQGAMQELLTGKRRLPGFRGEWEETSFGEITDQIVGGGTPSRNVPSYWNGDIPWVTVKDFAKFSPIGTIEYISQEGLNKSATHLIPKNTLIISTRMAVGRALIYDVDVSINQDLKAIFLKRDVEIRFLYYWFQLNEDRIAKLGSGSTVMGLSLVELRKISFAKPSCSEQTAIATILTDMDEEITALEEKLIKARQIKQGMMQELLTGRIRLV